SPPRPAKRRDSRLQHKIRRTGSKLGRPKNKGDPFPSRLCIVVFWVCLLSRTDNTRLDTRSIVSRSPTATFRKARSIGTSIYNRAVARRLASITAFLALMQAFFMASYQHVHVGSGHERHGNHAESTIVHAHPYAISFSINPDNGPAVGHSHKPHASLALDTFTTLAQGIPFLFFQPESPVHIFAPAESFV